MQYATPPAVHRPARVATRILFNASAPRPRKLFAVGVFVQKPARLPIGPSATDRQWAAEALNADSPIFSTSWADWQTHEGRTMSYAEYEALAAECSDTLRPPCEPDTDRLDAADLATLARLGQPLDNGPEWVWSDEVLDGVDANRAIDEAGEMAAWMDSYERGGVR